MYNESMNHVLIGDDDYLIEQALQKCLDDENQSEADIEYYDGLTMPLTIEDIMEAISTVSLFSNKKIVVVTHPLFVNTKDEKGNAALQRYYLHPDYSVSLIFVFKDGIDQRKTMVKTILKHSNVIHLDSVDDIGKRKLVSTMLNDKGIHLSQPLKEALLSRLANDGYTIAKEIDKLSLYGPIHTIDEINTLISPPLESSAYALSDAIASRDFAKAISIYRDLIRQGNQAVALVALLATNFRFYYQVLVLQDQNMDDATIADMLHIKKGRIFYASRILNHLTVFKADTVIRLLADLDQSIKQGRIEPNFGFEVMLLKLKEALI